jgi:hypothetical protein
MPSENLDLHVEASSSRPPEAAASLPHRARGASAIQRPPAQVRRSELPPELGQLFQTLDRGSDPEPVGAPLPQPAQSAAVFPSAAAAVAMAAAQAREDTDARTGVQDVAAATLTVAQARAAALSRATAAASPRAWSLRSGWEPITAHRLLAGILIAVQIVVAAVLALILTHSGG